MRQTTSVAYRRWAAGAWEAAGNDELLATPQVDTAVDALLPENDEAGALSLEALPPSCDVLAGLCGYLEMSESDVCRWDDLAGADEPDWHLDVPAFDSLESFAGFEGFDPVSSDIEAKEVRASLAQEVSAPHSSMLPG